MKRQITSLNKPRIGISMSFNPTEGAFSLAREYSEVILASGGIPAHFSLLPDREYVCELVPAFDGILLPGGSDIDPQLFGSEPKQGIGRIVPERDQTDLLILAEAEKLKLPILGICYGMQILNVFRGGTIIQDIPREVPGALEHRQGAPKDRLSHKITIEEDSVLKNLNKHKLSALVNSHHHQAIEKVGNNLKITARAADGIIEALEDTGTDKFILGVQWHPELNFKNDSFARNILSAFVEAAAQRKRLS